MPKNILGTTLSTTYHGSSDYKLFGTDGSFYLRHKFETLTWSSSGLDVSTMGAYGIARIVTSTASDGPSTSPATVTLAAPIVGCEKTIIQETTAAYVNTIDIDLGANVRVQGTSDGRYIAFSSLAGDHQSITLIGLSTAKWGVKSVDSTLGGFGAATGIRATTAARTS
jgi:hypothetical protein